MNNDLIGPVFGSGAACKGQPAYETENGVKVGGSGVGLFSDGNGPGRVSGNVIIRNELTDNGIPGVALHTHVGPKSTFT